MMADQANILVAESETGDQRRRRRESTGRSSGESYAATLAEVAPGATCEIVRPVDTGESSRASMPLSGYDGVFLSGSPLHVYEDSPDVRRQLAFI